MGALKVLTFPQNIGEPRGLTEETRYTRALISLTIENQDEERDPGYKTYLSPVSNNSVVGEGRELGFTSVMEALITLQ